MPCEKAVSSTDELERSRMAEGRRGAFLYDEVTGPNKLG